MIAERVKVGVHAGDGDVEEPAPRVRPRQQHDLARGERRRRCSSSRRTRRGDGRRRRRSTEAERQAIAARASKIIKGPPHPEAARSTPIADLRLRRRRRRARAASRSSAASSSARCRRRTTTRRARGPRVPLLLARRPDRARVDPAPHRRLRRGRPTRSRSSSRRSPGKVTVKDGPVDARSPDRRRRSASEREDTGF